MSWQPPTEDILVNHNIPIKCSTIMYNETEDLEEINVLCLDSAQSNHCTLPRINISLS